MITKPISSGKLPVLTSMTPITGVMLVNTGTPDILSERAIQAYLSRFLTDRRIVNIPAVFWRPILRGIVLRTRPKKTLAIYRSIWTADGSPYTLHSQALEAALQREFSASESVWVALAQRYGNPSIGEILRRFRDAGVTRLIVTPLYPQQAYATTHSVCDELTSQLKRLDFGPEIRFIEDYHQHPAYLGAMAVAIRDGHLPQPQSHLLFSFHSIPLKDIRNGDVYPEQVKKTVRSLSAALGLAPGDWSLAYQSRFDDAQRWLGPFLRQECKRLMRQGVRHFTVVCPGFSIDCTETLHDIKQVLPESLNTLAGEMSIDPAEVSCSYIPALNADPAHISALKMIISEHLW
jgi:ferrochelatase